MMHDQHPPALMKLFQSSSRDPLAHFQWPSKDMSLPASQTSSSTLVTRSRARWSSATVEMMASLRPFEAQYCTASTHSFLVLKKLKDLTNGIVVGAGVVTTTWV